MTNMSYFSIPSMMMLMMILITLLTSFIHPVLIILMILMYSLILCLNMSLWKPSYLYSILFFMVMISGLLIIFLYFSSLLSNTKSSHPLMSMAMKFTLIILIPPILLTMIYSLEIPSYGNPPNDFMMFSMNLTFHQPISIMYLSPAIPPTLISMMYLLITLMSIIKVLTPKISSMRKIK